MGAKTPLFSQMNELDNEDSKKDTLVDVVFKKALKEFRQNIFSFYSSALAVSDQMMGGTFTSRRNGMFWVNLVVQVLPSPPFLVCSSQGIDVLPLYSVPWLNLD